MAKQSSDQQYIVVHEAVGMWRKGTLITEGDVAEGDVPRLLRLGAIKKATAEEIEAAAEVDNTDLHSAMLGARDTLSSDATSPHRAPRLTTGQPGGAPTPAEMKDK